MASTSKGKEPLEAQYAGLHINEGDDVEIQVGEEVVNPVTTGDVFSLVGTLLTERSIKFNYMKETLSTIWRPVRGMVAKEISTNLFVFYFFHAKDMQRVLDDGPWSYDQNLLILHKLGNNESPYAVNLDRAGFWVQIHKIPQPLTNARMAEVIGSSLGTFIKADISNFDGTHNAFIRIRVSIDVNKPLRRIVRIKQANGESLILECKYERLPTFCFTCGKIGHAEKYCPQQLDINDEGFIRPFGPELRASGRRSNPLNSRWLLPEFPTFPFRPPATLAGNDDDQAILETRVESTRYEEGLRQTTFQPSLDPAVNTQNVEEGQTFNQSSFNASSDGINVHADAPMAFPAHTSVLDILMGEQNRKRQAHEIGGPVTDALAHADIMCVDQSFSIFCPKNMPEAGPGAQARLDQ
ncbi:PREDICTED: uncharacterized protein LOC109147843 [Ipomoea nil]|uniref:uncharacterized protein LOC109147843 n=1 Tax=Ipomoea nil TaxID=35883 RepID=UPI0009017C0E|nr:PREDICTED: uncharacterized protein LOC109147843 [Ipomoea nil]